MDNIKKYMQSTSPVHPSILFSRLFHPFILISIIVKPFKCQTKWIWNPWHVSSTQQAALNRIKTTTIGNIISKFFFLLFSLSLFPPRLNDFSSSWNLFFFSTLFFSLFLFELCKINDYVNYHSKNNKLKKD